VSQSEDLERLTEAINRLIVRVRSLQTQRDELSVQVNDLESRLENSVDTKDSEGYNILRIHSARLLRERQEIRRRLSGVLGKLENIELQANKLEV
jgi:FtsZ-binding cell division protein ZapB